MSSFLEKILEEIDQLTLEEQFEVIHHTTNKLKHRSGDYGLYQSKCSQQTHAQF